MSKRIIIDPVTRIEGHAKISIYLGDAGQVTDAEFHVVEFRGFEKFCEGRPFSEMPGITQRICGICPVSHMLASTNAGDALMAVSIPPAADKLRRLVNLGQIIQSHALSFFHLSAPDFLLGWETPVAQRNVFGLIQSNTDLARAGIRLRQFGQEIIEVLGGKKIHPAWAVPGGVRSGLSEEGRTKIRAWLPESYATARIALDLFKQTLETHQKEVAVFGNFSSLFMGLVTPDGSWEHHGGKLRFTSSEGALVADQLDPQTYLDYIGESVSGGSYLKSPYYTPLGFPKGIYRVGPLARLNVAERFGTPEADRELTEYRQRCGAVAHSSFHFHYARLIELIHGLEKIEVLLNHPDILGKHVRSHAPVNCLEGVGMIEAPRGVLIHHYKVDEMGAMKWANLIVATGHNNLAINRSVAQVAKHFIHGNELKEGMLNRVSAVVRAYDPCLSCSTHADGTLEMEIKLIGADGAVLDRMG